MSLYLFFGEHSVTIFDLPIHRIRSPVRSLRRHGFRVCPRTNAALLIEVPRNECAESSGYGH